MEETPKRAITEPPTGGVVKGPREGFIEDIETNVALIEKRIKKDLKFKELTIGRYTKTKIKLAYIESIADEEVAENIEKKLKKIDIDGVIDSYYLVEFLQERTYSFVKQVSADEKPDSVCAKLLEGRVAILVDGSPIVLCVPYLLLEDLQASDDYYSNHTSASLSRAIRFFGALIAILLPALYIALKLHHFALVPLPALLALIGDGGGSALSPMFETIGALILFEIIMMATLSMPKNLGAPIGIVGAIVLGDTAVNSGLISGSTVLVCAIASVTSFCIPNLSSQISLLKFTACFIGAFFGLFGIMLALIVFVIYVCGLNNFGTPILAPFAPHIKEDAKDGILKSALPEMVMRPKSIPNKNPVRAKIKQRSEDKNG
ncbi:MAG: spore germination protein [Christensenellaceae bacterium]|nr:spore germination protein [Christensenellaceae bacterium]